VTPSPEPIPQDRASAIIQSYLGLGGAASTPGPLPHQALCAEVLRAILWSHWSVDGQPAYVTRLLGGAARALLPWQGTLDDEAVRSTLDELEAIGDFAAVPGGRWAPAPLRLVEMPVISRWLMLGGVPASQLPPQLQSTIERSGVARLIPARARADWSNIDTVPEREWLRPPPGDLRAWAQDVVAGAQLDPAGSLTAEIYAPAYALPAVDQFHRWRQSAERLPDGRFLARTRLRRGGASYYIAQVTRGVIAAAGRPHLGDGDIRRLMYGLDALASRPVRVRVERRRTDWRFRFGSELPRAEHRLLLALGREEPREDGRYYPRWWTVRSGHEQAVIIALGTLGVEVKVL
jgi:hypothetical protein